MGGKLISRGGKMAWWPPGVDTTISMFEYASFSLTCLVVRLSVDPLHEGAYHQKISECHPFWDRYEWRRLVRDEVYFGDIVHLSSDIGDNEMTRRRKKKASGHLDQKQLFIRYR
jgi:hypothetical protein